MAKPKKAPIAAVLAGLTAAASSEDSEAAKPFHLTPRSQTGLPYSDLIKLLAAKDKEIMSSMAAIPDETGPISASHVSKADFDKFSSTHLGSGQGHATFGQGHYFATLPEVKDSYIEEFTDGNLQFHGKAVRGPGDMPGLRRFSTGDSKIVDTTRQDGRGKNDWHDDIFDQIIYFEKHDPSTPEGQANKQAEIQNLYQKFLGYNTPEDAMEYANRYFVRRYEQATQVAQWAKAGDLQWKSTIPNTYDVELDAPRDKFWQLDTKLEANPDIFEAVKRAFEKAKVPFESSRGTGLDATNDFNHGTGGQDKKTRLMLSRGVFDAGYPGAGYFDQQSRRQYIDVAKANNPKQKKDKNGFNRSTPVHLDPEQMSATEKLLGLTKNYVMFPGSEKLIRILKKAPSEYTSDDYKIIALAAATLGAGLSTQDAEAAAQAQDSPMPEGQIERGNIDLFRPSIPNPDGGESTVYSASFNFGGEEVLLPLADKGRILRPEEAIEEYQRTGKHLGKFSTPEAATAYAEQLHNDYQSNKYASPYSAAPQQGPLPAPADSLYMDYLGSLLQGPEDQKALGYFGKDPEAMNKFHEEAKPPEYDQFLAAAQPALTELSQKFLDKYDEDGNLANTLTQNYTDIYNNILGQPYDKSNKAAKEWVDTFIGLMQSHNPGGDNAEIPFRDPEEVDHGIGGYLNGKFSLDKAGVLRSQMLDERKLNLLKTFQEGANAPLGSGTIDKVLADVGSVFANDNDETVDLAAFRQGGRPSDKVKEAMYWWDKSDRLNDPNTTTSRNILEAFTPGQSWTTFPGMAAQSTATNTLTGAGRNLTYETLANLRNVGGQESQLPEFRTATQALNQQAPPIPEHLRPDATKALPMLRQMEQESFVDPAVEWVRLQKLLGMQNPSYPSLFTTSQAGGWRENIDIPTLLTAGITGGLSLLGKSGARSALWSAAKNMGRNVIEDFGQEAGFNAAVGQTYQPEGDSMYDYFTKEGPGLTDDEGKPVAANSPQWDKWDQERTKQYDTRFATIADLGSQLGKPQPAAQPVVPLQPQTPYDKEYDEWRKSMAKPQPMTQSQQGQKYMDYLSNMRR